MSVAGIPRSRVSEEPAFRDPSLGDSAPRRLPPVIRDAEAKALIDRAGDGEIEAFVTHVLQSFYEMPVARVATLMRDKIALPGVEPYRS